MSLSLAVLGEEIWEDGWVKPTLYRATVDGINTVYCHLWPNVGIYS